MRHQAAKNGREMNENKISLRRQGKEIWALKSGRIY